MKTKELLSRAAYARRRGVAPRTIGKYVQRGILPVHDDKLDPEECDQLLSEYLVQPLGSGGQPMSNGGKKGTYVEARTQEKRLKVELLELDVALKKGEMILAKDVEVAAFTAAREIRDKMLNVPDQVSAICAGEMDELKVRDIIMSAIESGLTGIAESYNRHRTLNNGS